MPSGEDKLIARFFKPLATHPGALSLLDDAAIFEPPAGHDLVLTADAVTGGVHFFPDDPADTIARKALRVNLSDLAAKGAKPHGFLMTLALPSAIDDAWLEKFSAGLRADTRSVRVSVVRRRHRPHGRAGHVSRFRVRQRAEGHRWCSAQGAKPGDRILVTGTIGDAALGLAASQGRRRCAGLEARRWDARSSRRPLSACREPRNALADALRAHASAAMDVSDGLAGDLAKLCGVSGVSAEVDVASVPLSAAAQRALAADRALIETILTRRRRLRNRLHHAAGRGGGIPRAGRQGTMSPSPISASVVDGTDEPRFIDANGAALVLLPKVLQSFLKSHA